MKKKNKKTKQKKTLVLSCWSTRVLPWFYPVVALELTPGFILLEHLS